MPAPVVLSTIHKGGVGKTTTCRVLAQAIADDPKLSGGKPVLLIDLDPQANTSRRFQLMRPLGNGMSVPVPHPRLVKSAQDRGEHIDPDDMLAHTSSVCDLWQSLLGLGDAVLIPEPYPTSNPMIHVVPANEQQLIRTNGMGESHGATIASLMLAWLRSDEIRDTYSYVIVDTAPGKAAMNDAAIYAATHVYVPFIPEPQSLDGVYSMFSHIFTERKKRGPDNPLHLIGLLPNLVQRTDLHRRMLKTLESSEGLGSYVMPVRLARRTLYAETDLPDSRPDQVTDAKGSTSSVEAIRFARYVVQRVRETSGGRVAP